MGQDWNTSWAPGKTKGTKGEAEHFEFATQLPPVGPKISVGYVGYV